MIIGIDNMTKHMIPPSPESTTALKHPIVVVNRFLEHKTVVERHRHTWGQFIYANDGVLAVVSNKARYVIPSQQGVWMPPNQWHEVSAICNTELTSLYIDKPQLYSLQNSCRVLDVTPFTQTLIVEAKAIPNDFSWNGTHGRLLRLILDRLSTSEEVDLQLPYPTDKRLRQILEEMLANTSVRKNITQWAHEVGASSRTLSRLFKKETGMTYSEWKQRLHVQLAIRQLYDGVNITKIALNLGYQSVSAFIYMFKKSTGSTPTNHKQ